MKTLLVHYTPRNERSNTKKLVDTFHSEIKNSEIEELNLSRDLLIFFLRKTWLHTYSETIWAKT